MKTGTILVFSGAALLLLAFLMGPPARLWPTYLVAWLFVTTVSAGGLFFVLIHHLTRSAWSVVLRRQAEAAASALPVLALLYVPIALKLDAVYPWASEALIGHKAVYLSPEFFRLRAFVYLSSWSLIALWFRRLSIGQDTTGSVAMALALRRASGPALVLYGSTLSFAAFDWIMSLEPNWVSSLFGVYVFAGSAVSYFAAQAVLLSVLYLRRSALEATLEHFHALGKLLFGFVCFWAYIAFSQFLLIWYAGLPEETVWYAHRLRDGWEWIVVALALGHFVLPFVFLLPVRVKKSPSLLLATGLFLLSAHYLDIYWLVLPATTAGASPRLVDLLALGALSLVAGGVPVGLLRRAPLTPSLDPRLDESLSFDNA